MKEAGVIALNRLQSVYGLYLRAMWIGPELTLNIVVDEANRDETAEDLNTGNPALDAAIGPAYPIASRPGCYRFTILFEDVVTMALRDETVSKPEPTENHSQRLRRYDESTFLEFVRAGNYSGHPVTNNLIHSAVVTYDAVIDVASQAEPVVTAALITEDKSDRVIGLTD